MALLAIAVSIRCTLFRSSAPMASSRIRRVSTPSTPSASATATQPDRRQPAKRRDDHDRGDHREQVGDDLPPEDQDLLGVLELVAHEEGEVEQRARREEVPAHEDGDGRQQIEREVGPAGQGEHRRVGPVRRGEGEDLPAGIDHARAGQLAEPEHVGGEDADPQRRDDRRGPDGHRAHERRHAGLREVGILAESNRRGPQREDGEGHDERRDRCASPARSTAR